MGPDGEHRGSGGARTWRTEFAAAASKFDWPAVDRLTTEYVEYLYGSRYPHEGVPSILLELREHLRYEQLEKVADAALARSPGYGTVRRHYAQALVDRGNPALAVRLYAALADDATVRRDDRTDAKGGVGRCYKEMFLLCQEPGLRAEYLRRAFEAYYAVYATDPTEVYHGINAVALAARAEREAIPLPPWTPAVVDLAATILGEVDGRPVPDQWNATTAAEACIALGRHDDVIDRVGAFLTTEPSGFVVASFLRQLTIVWQLDSRERPGDRLLAMLRSALLAYRGGEVKVDPGDVRATRLSDLTGNVVETARLERVLGTARFQTYRWYVNGLARCRAVARIQDRSARGVGTGFLVEGPALHPALPRRVLVTNAHVVPERLAVGSVVAAFHGLDDDPGPRAEFEVERLLWSDPSANGLDTTILALRGYPDVPPIPLGPVPEPGAEQEARAYVIGHPGGIEQPQFSLQDNLLLDHDERVLHYRSPTEGGSSGSPVMNDQWELIGLHHAGAFALPRLNGRGGTYAANEGIRVAAIRAALELRPPADGE